MHSWRNENFSLRGDFTVNKVQLEYFYKNIEDRVDLGSIEVRNDQGSSRPVKRCELTKGERANVRVDHIPSKARQLGQ